MRTLFVEIERSKNRVPVGTITGQGPSDSVFRYDESYLQDQDAAAISLSLPLREDPFSAQQTSSFFEGLLPEGFTRRAIAQWMHADEGDYLTILHGLGRECLGAISIREEGETTDRYYERITKTQIQELAAEGASKSAEIVTQTHLSLTGASGKVGLYYDADHNEWYLPHGTAPSTHIVKQSHIRLDHLVTNEQLSLSTAARCQITVPQSFIINMGQGREDEVLFATRRYDRLISNEYDLAQIPVSPSSKERSRRRGGTSAKTADAHTLPRPLRLHQEDFAQAMGIPSHAKYERKQSGYLKSMFDLLRRCSANPIEDQLQLWDRIVFNWLIGNTDAHIKNFSLLYAPSLKSIRLAPAYDIVSTTVYEQSTKEMSFHIGRNILIDEIGRDSFQAAARDAGLGVRMAMQRFDRMCEMFRPALHQAAQELQRSGYSYAARMEKRILRNGGIRLIQS